jgi:hypothetical protein
MAQIIVTDTQVNLNVTTTLSNITVTDLETNITVNVASLSSNIAVTNETVNVTLAPSIGVSNSEVRAALGNTNPILYDVDSGVFSFDGDAAFNNAKVIGAIQSGNVTLKQVQETYFNLGNTSTTTLSINIANGTIQRTLLQSNVDQISFANLSPGGAVTVFLEQDAFGFRSLDTSTNFNNWLFVDDYKTLSVGAGNVDSLSVIFDGSTYYASLTRLNASDIDATFDNLTVRYNTISNVLTANTVTVNNGLTSTATSNFVGAVTLGNNLNVAGQLFADGNQIYIGKPGTATNKIITAYSSATAGQIYYGGADSTWYFVNNTGGGGTFKLPTSTTDLAQGTNLYFTTDQANNAIAAYKGTINTTGNIQGNFILGNGAFLTGVTGTSNAQVVSYIATQPLTVGGNLTVNGNINATGNINVQNVTDLYVRDQIIVLNANAATNANVQIISNRPTATSTSLRWNEQSTRWEFTNDGTTYFPIPTSTTDLAEGTNLYYTSARANSAIAAYQGNINTIGSLTVGTAEINGNLVLDPAAGNANIVGQSAADDLTVAFENIELKIGTASDEGRFYIKEHEGPALLSLSGAETDNNTLRILGDVIIGVDPNTGNTLGQFVFDVSDGDLDVAGGLEAETLFGNTAISSLNGDIFTTSGDIYTTSGNVSGAYIKGNGSELTGLTTTQVTEGTNLYFTDARVRGNVSATTASGITYDSGTGVFSLASIPNSSLTNSAITINGTAVSLGGTRTLTTSNIAEGTNLYYNTDRANTAIGAYQGSINTTGNIQGNYILGNGAFLTGITTAAVTQVDTGENLTGGPITSTGTIGLANALGNVNSVTSQANVNFAVNTDKKLILSQQYKNTTTYSGNISGQGYAVIGGRLPSTAVVNTTANALPSILITSGFSAAGTNEISNVTVQWYGNSAPASVNDIKSNYAFTTQFGQTGQSPFPQGSYVTSVDAANSKVFMSQIEINGFSAGVINGVFAPAARDAETGLLISFVSAADASGGAGAANVIAQTTVHNSGLYAYPATGWDPTYFTYAVGTASDYNMSGTTDLAWAKTSIEGEKSILNSPYGLTLGSRTDPSQMGTDDTRPRFGLNVLWDGLTPPEEFGNVTPTTGILLRQYNDPVYFDRLDKVRSGPSIIFTASEGNASQPFRETYTRNNTELGKIAWVIPSNSNPTPSFNIPQTWINCLSGQDADVNQGGGQRVSGAGVYFANSPNVLNTGRGLYFANTKGNTLIAGGAFGTSKINFGPMNLNDGTGNSASMYNLAEGNKFAQIGYANTSTARGSEVAVTNGRRYGSPAVGDLQFTFNRIDNTNGTVPSGVSSFDNDWNYIPTAEYGDPADLIVTEQNISLPNSTAVVPSGFTGDYGNAVNGNTYYVQNVGFGGGVRFYFLYTDVARTIPLDLGIAGGAYGPGIYTYTLASGVSGVTNKTWNITLEEQSNDLKFKANGSTVATITDAGNITASNFIGNVTGNVTGFVSAISNFTTSNLAEGTNLYYTNARARASISGTGDISYDANTGIISYTGTPGDITDVIAGDGLTGGGTSGNVTLTVGAGTGITVNADNVAVNMGAFSTSDLAEGTNLYYTSDRANTAIDTRVNKAYVDALGVDYNSLANAPTNVSAFTNDAGYLVAANLASLTANVTSVNGQTGVVTLDTDDVAEGTNLYYSNTRVNAFIQDNITTSDIDEGTNLYYTSDRANTAIDTRVNKAFVEGLGVSYTSLTDKPSIPTHTSNLTNDSGFITTATANVLSVNGASGVVTLDTGDIPENGNLYFTTARANTAIDNRVNKTYVETLAISYTSLANTPTNVSAFTNDAGYLVAANLASLTANVTSVNGQTGVVVLDSDDVAEGSTNLYYSNTRVNAFIQDNITTSDIDEGTNLYYTSDRANTAIGAYQGNINTTGTITAGAFTGDGSDLTDVRADTVEEKVINKSGGTLAKGTPVFATGGATADVLWVAACDAANITTMPCIGILAQDLADDAEGRAIVIGRISGVDTSAFSAGDQLYVAAGGGYANVAPTGENNIIQGLGVVTRVDASQGGGIVNVVAENSTPNLNNGNVFIGNSSNVAVSKSLVTAITDSNVTLKQYSETRVDLGSTGGNITLDMANGSIFAMTATSSISNIALANASVGSSGTLIITQDGTGGKTLTTTSAWKFASGSKTLSTAANAIDVISFFTDGTTVFAALSKGYA